MSDDGNYYHMTNDSRPVSPPYFAGRWSNGRTWVEYLATALGLPDVTPALLGGTNYAVAGGASGASDVHAQNNTDLPSQLATFLANTRADGPVAGALYTMDIGANDLTALIDAIQAGTVTTEQQQHAVIDQIVSNVTTSVSGLYDGGMRNLLFVDAPDQTLQPAHNRATAQQQAQIKSIDTAYNAQVVPMLQALASADGFRLTILELPPILSAVVNDAAAYGFTTSVLLPCYSGSPVKAQPALLCSAGLDRQNTYLFWDMIHPTTAGHALIAGFAYTALLGDEAAR